MNKFKKFKIKKFKMNKDVVRLVYCFIYRLKIDDVMEEYRKLFKSSRVNDGRIYCVSTTWHLNYRNLHDPNDYDATIYNFKTHERISIKKRNY